LDTENWGVVYLSKPLRFEYDKRAVGASKDIILGGDKGVLMDRHSIPGGRVKNMIQYPVSLMRISERTFHMSVNVRDAVTLLYEVILDESVIKEVLSVEGTRKRIKTGSGRAAPITGIGCDFC
jgi:hypothetical protein